MKECLSYVIHFRMFRGCLVCDFKQPFSVFKQHFTQFNTLFHPHVFPQMFLNNNFQFLNTQTKQALSTENRKLLIPVFSFQIILLNDTFINILKVVGPTYQTTYYRLKKTHTHTYTHTEHIIMFFQDVIRNIVPNIFFAL